MGKPGNFEEHAQNGHGCRGIAHNATNRLCAWPAAQRICEFLRCVAARIRALCAFEEHATFQRVRRGFAAGLLAALVPQLATAAACAGDSAFDSGRAFVVTWFDAEGAVHGTFPAAISFEGEITGTWYDTNYVVHGFVRDRCGRTTNFDVPGANSTSPTSINARGEIAGNWSDAMGATHGFVRDRWGRFATFDVTGATSIVATTINVKGEVAGYYSGPNNHGFVRDSHGAITFFDVPDATDTVPNGNNIRGEVVGSWYDPKTLDFRGFVRQKDDAFQTFDAGLRDTLVRGINARGEMVGYYTDKSFVAFEYHGFVKDADGTMTSFDMPGAASTFSTSINFWGQAAGYYVNIVHFLRVSHAFVRDRNGTITTIDPTGATSAVANGINAAGEVAGYYTDAQNNTHGFVHGRQRLHPRAMEDALPSCDYGEMEE